VRIGLLGPLEVRDAGGGLVDLAGDRLRTVLARLALTPGRPVSAAALVDAVWAEEPPVGEQNALQSLVSRLRRALPGDLPIERSAAGYRLVVDAGEVDLGRFEALTGRGRSAGTGEEAVRYLTEALRLWRGEPLCDVDGARLAPATVSRLHELRLSAVEDLADAQLTTIGSTDLAALTELVAAYPLRERARALLMRGLWAAGRSAEALSVYAQLSRALTERLGTDPSAPVRDLHTAMLRGTWTEFAAAAPSGNLRAPLTSFVGRETELARLDAALSQARLVTLVGPGGAGKTRLATEAGRHWTDRTGHPVWLVELAGVTDPGEVAGAVLAALGHREGGAIGVGRPQDRPPVERLVEVLRPLTSVLVLDNCEHLLHACAELATAVLGQCPDATVLVTTREPLAVIGEVLLPVGPLAFPVSDVDCPQAMDYPAVRLFADRMAAVRPGLAVTPANLADVLDVCRRLDGLPLALELACARLRTLTLNEIAARLSDRFRLLTGGSRTAVARHQTLLAVVAWSWDLFGEPERRLARRLAVFAGGATLDAIETVCGDEGADGLASLVDKSFVDFDPAGARYRMLDTVRAYAAATLADAGESDRIRAAHAAHFLARVEQAEPALRGADQLRWLRWLEEEYDNIIAALRWAIDSDQVDTALRFVAGLGWYWVLRGGSAEGAPWLRQALAIAGGSVPADPTAGRSGPDTAVLAAVYAYDAIHHFSVSELARAKASAATVRELAGDGPAAHPAIAFVTVIAGLTTFDLATVFAALSRLAEYPDPWVAAAGRLVRGHAAETFGLLDRAGGHFAAARAQFVALGDRWGTMMAVGALAGSLSLAGDHPAAIATFTEAEQLAVEVSAAEDAAWSRGRCGLERFRAGDTDGGYADLRHALAFAVASRSAALAAMAEIWLAEADRAGGDLGTAEARLTGALSRLDGVPGALPPRIRVVLITALARLDLARGDPAAARDRLADAMDAASAIGDRPTVASVAEVLADLALAEESPAGAARLLGLAVAARGTLDHGSPEVRATVLATRTALGSPTADAILSDASTVDPDEAVKELVEWGQTRR
jgi:predicted ATPase/DNA-binding SARP family transcriptional activator